MLGPDQFGVVSAATVYVTLSMLVLDQGFSAALIQRRDLSARAPGAVASVNLLVAAALAALTWFLAPALGSFFHAPELTGLLRVLGFGLMLKALDVTPRAMLSRHLRMREVGLADVSGALIGATAGIAAAVAGAG